MKKLLLVDEILKPAQVVMFSVPYCPYCTRAYSLLTKMSINFESYDVRDGTWEKYYFILLSVFRMSLKHYIRSSYCI